MNFKLISIYHLLLIFFCISIFSPLKMSASETPSNLIINLQDGKTQSYSIRLLNNIKTNEDYIEINYDDDSISLAIEDILSFGLIIDNQENSAVDIITEEIPSHWQIFNLRGELIKEGYSSKPDLSGLRSGELYIINADGKSFKYMPYR